MRTYPFQRIIALLCVLLFPLSACKKELAPFSSENGFTPIEDSVATEQEIIPDVWDLSDTDVSEIDPSRNLIAFTFDDAPSSELENILAVFAEFNENNPDCKAFASVFCNGYLCDESSLVTLHAAYALGFEMGNHTYSHFDLTSLSESKLKMEIDETDKLLQRIYGKKRHLLRAPFGKINDFVKQTAYTPLIDWTIDTLDWTGKSEKEIFDEVFNHKKDGHIVLMHDTKGYTTSALKLLLPSLKEANYQVVSVSQLAKAHGCVLKRGNVYIRARKQF